MDQHQNQGGVNRIQHSLGFLFSGTSNHACCSIFKYYARLVATGNAIGYELVGFEHSDIDRGAYCRFAVEEERGKDGLHWCAGLEWCLFDAGLGIPMFTVDEDGEEAEKWVESVRAMTSFEIFDTNKKGAMSGPKKSLNTSHHKILAIAQTKDHVVTWSAS